MALYAQTSGTHSTNAPSLVLIPALSLTVPEGVGTSALVVLNAPMPPPSTGRVPTMLVLSVPLGSKPQTIVGDGPGWRP